MISSAGKLLLITIIISMTSGCAAIAALRDRVSGGGDCSLGCINEEVLEESADLAGVSKARVVISKTGSIDVVGFVHSDPEVVPQKARDLVEERFPGAPIKRWSEVLEGDGKMYHVALIEDVGGTCSIGVDGGGTLEYTACELDPGDLPQEVIDAHEETSGNIIRAARYEGPRETYFIIERQEPGCVHYLEVSPEGEIFAHDLIVTAQMRLPYLGQPLRQPVVEGQAPPRPPPPPEPVTEPEVPPVTEPPPDPPQPTGPEYPSELTE